ncbi:uncharacterized protein LOC123556787 [Mercenaria mercenaria]|uniref:uncharacterized protein LOC123556787 n=1 Tax=Mercenaria mercenaria TaxID=6596 RepID=UPI001E1E0F02|nr:uncharacterized protein LOC123556787 [Mercenaria mercenaria]
MISWAMMCWICVGFAASMEGLSNTEDWAYQWYSDESFRFQCYISGLNVSQTDYVTWQTPDQKTLPKSHNDTVYGLISKDNVADFELLIKKINPNVHGVYICKVHDDQGVVRGHTIYGLNIHEAKYHEILDKYKRQINVAIIATAVFLVPVITICLVWHFQYVTPEMEAKRRQRKTGKPYSVSNDMQMATNGQLADSMASPEWKGAYENPEVFTQL